MGYAILKKKQAASTTPKQVKYATVERFVEYADALAGCGGHNTLEELLADARKQWAEFLEFEEGKLTDEIVAAAAPQLEYYFKDENA